MKQLHKLSPYPGSENTSSAFSIGPLQRLSENGTLQRDDHFKIIWITRGKGTYRLAQLKGLTAQNQLLFVKPGQLCNLQLTDELDGYIISFSSSFLDVADSEGAATYSNFYQVFARTQTTAAGTELEDMETIMAIMIKEFRRNHLFRCDILKRYLKIFLLYVSGFLDHPVYQPRHSRNEAIVDRFMSLLENNFRTQKTVAYFAEALSVTPNYLNEVIKKTTGCSAGHHIRQRVALEAKRQAASSNICMKSVAYDLGFCDMAHFSKFFKNTTGMNFSEFKNRDRILQSVI
ncbi:helix-turn-helix transcriptional regulator [Mucilaginibacter sp.]|uniref:AraC family transcriptional regulator n=1 Tax=Mucilaginibacter sp. TaxID=1882438 RepID=UPI0035BC4BB1